MGPTEQTCAEAGDLVHGLAVARDLAALAGRAHHQPAAGACALAADVRERGGGKWKGLKRGSYREKDTSMKIYVRV